MQNEYGKTKTSPKLVLTRGAKLQDKVLTTMAKISEAVGATLGPGGLPVIIERNEQGLPNIITKDGVTVFRNLGYSDSVEHCIMETARSAAIRTASEAGDGTTTATVLSEAIVRNLMAYCKKYPKISPQKVVRILEQTFKNHIEPVLNGLSVKASNLSKVEDKEILHSIARISANGDADLADAVIKCFELVGDEGNVTITEQNGPSAYEVERIKGFPVFTGYEESCARFFQLFINDAAQQRVYLEKPIFVLYHGVINEMQTILNLMNSIAQAWQENNFNHNVVLVANGFSENVLGNLALNFVRPDTINVFPLLAPKSPIQSGQLHFLEDLAAVAGTYVFNPITRPLDQARIEDLGSGVDFFESLRFRSNIVGHANEDRLLERVETLQSTLGHEESIFERSILEERIGKLTGGIAKLKVIGASDGELREKKDRAEDAVCAVRGAIKKGCLPGGGWCYLFLSHYLTKVENNNTSIFDEVLKPSLYAPVYLLLHNAGLNGDEISYVLGKIEADISKTEVRTLNKFLTYDVAEMKHVDAFKSGILDSAPAVIEALRNSFSIASLLGTLGGAIVFPRDRELDKSRTLELNDFQKSIEQGDQMEQEARFE